MKMERIKVEKVNQNLTWRFRERSNILQWVRFHYSIILFVAYLACLAIVFHAIAMHIGKRRKKSFSRSLDGLGYYCPRRSPTLQELQLEGFARTSTFLLGIFRPQRRSVRF